MDGRVNRAFTPVFVGLCPAMTNERIQSGAPATSQTSPEHPPCPRQARGRAAQTARRAIARPRARKRPRTKRRVPHYQACTPEMEANIRQRYEETDEPIDTIAADRGVAPAVCGASPRRKAGCGGSQAPAALTPAMRFLAEAERLETALLPPPLTLPAARGGGNDRAAYRPPAPTAAGRGSPTEPEAPLSPDLHLATIERLEAAVLQGAHDGRDDAREPRRRAATAVSDAQLTARTLSVLTETLGEARAPARCARAAAAATASQLHHDDYARRHR